ncbi:hypothetical protein ACFLZ6_00160 [Nanoarchaeota archaeon]
MRAKEMLKAWRSSALQVESNLRGYRKKRSKPEIEKIIEKRIRKRMLV